MSDSLRPLAVDRRRLDAVPAKAATRTEPVGRSQIEAFENAMRVRLRSSLAHGTSLRGVVDQLIIPRIADPGIFGNERAIQLLEHVITAILPTLDANEDVTFIAKAMLEEEIARRHDLQACIDEEGGLG